MRNSECFLSRDQEGENNKIWPKIPFSALPPESQPSPINTKIGTEVNHVGISLNPPAKFFKDYLKYFQGFKAPVLFT